MNKPAGTEYRSGLTLEEALRGYASSPEPEAAFVGRLEQKLLRAQRTMDVRPEKASARRRPWGPLRWALVGAAVLLALAVPLLLIGPERVWAEIQAWLDYVPGVGFVDLEHSLTLTVPRSVTQAGVTLTVEQVVAGPQKTTVVLRSEGDRPRNGSASEGGALQARLRLPDGTALSPQGWSIRDEGATLVFPPLPEGVSVATLELDALPWAPEAGEAGWQVAFELQPHSGDQGAADYPPPYRPEGASDSHDGITLTVLEVAHTAEETAVQLQLSWENPTWVNRSGARGWQLPYLVDPAGRAYRVAPSSSSGNQVGIAVQTIEAGGVAPTLDPTTWIEIETFEAVSPTVEALTLVAEDVRFWVPADDSFTVDLGEDPQIGDQWDLDLMLDVAGFPVHVTGMRLLEEEVQGRDSKWMETTLMFELEPVAPQENRALESFDLTAPEAGSNGSRGQGLAPGDFQTGITWSEQSALPSGPIVVHVRNASMLVRGPWRITWPVPAAR